MSLLLNCYQKELQLKFDTEQFTDKQGEQAS